MTERIRQSEFQVFADCRRKWHFAYVMNLMRAPSDGPRMPSSSHRDTGTAFHAGAAVIHKGGTEASAEAAITEYVNETRAIGWLGKPPELSKADTPEWWEVERMAQAMLRHYIAWLEEGHDSGYHTLEVEGSWEQEIPGTNGIVAYGQWDLVGYDDTLGGETIEDLKGVATLAVPHPSNFQLRTYAWARWRQTGNVPRQAALRQARRVLGTGKAQPPFVDRYPIHINEDILFAHEEQLAIRAVEIVEARRRSIESPILYPNPSQACNTWACDYKSMCPMVDERDDWLYIAERDFTVKSDDREEAPHE